MLNESIVEEATLKRFGELDSTAGHGPQQFHTLSSLRDKLLPKLQGGELQPSAMHVTI